MSDDANKLWEELDHFDGKSIQPITDIMDEYIFPIQSFIKYMEKVNGEINHYVQLLSLCDQAREDLLHCMEFENLTIGERSKLTAKLINVQRARRSVKTHLECINAIRDVWLKDNYVGTRRKLTDALNRLTAMENRQYTDRTPIITETIGGKEAAS